MFKIIWAIQENLPKNTSGLGYALQQLEFDFVPVSTIPLIDDLNGDIPDTKNIIPYGSTKLVRIAKSLEWAGLCFNDNFNVDSWIENRTDMLNQDAIVTTIGNIDSLNLKEQDYFVRPLYDLKRFNGRVMTFEELKTLTTANVHPNNQLTEDIEIAISKPKEILAEHRWFIVDRKIVSGSYYRKNGKVKLEKINFDNYMSLLNQVNKMLTGWLPHDACVLDTACINESGKLKIIEFNCINASGFYDADVFSIAESLHSFAQK